MKITAIDSQANFQHGTMTKPNKLTNLLYSAALSASLLSATATDTFKKSENIPQDNVAQVEPQKAQWGPTYKFVNEACGKDSDSNLAPWLIGGIIAAICYIHSTFFDGKQQN